MRLYTDYRPGCRAMLSCMADAARGHVPPPPRASRPFRRIAAVSLAVLIVAALLDAGWSAVDYRVLPGPATIGGIHWCGRDYVNSTGTEHTKAQVEAMAPGPLRWVGGYPPLPFVGGQLYATVTPASRRNSVSPPLPCSMAVYLRTGQNEYKAYVLSGGP